MIQIQHVQDLERKVSSALNLIRSLRIENSSLKQKLDGYEERIGELESLVREFKDDQGAIEEGILRALKQLDTLEDAVTGVEEAAQKTPVKPLHAPAGPVESSETPGPESAPDEPIAVEADEEGSPESGDSELDIF